MRKAREMVAIKIYGKKGSEKKDEFDEDEKMVSKHLAHDIKESEKSIGEDKKLRKSLKKMD